MNTLSNFRKIKTELYKQIKNSNKLLIAIGAKTPSKYILSEKSLKSPKEIKNDEEK